MINRSVIVVGAGPTGLMLAGELALAGVDVTLLESRSREALVGMRARGVHARTIELFDQRGIADRFLDRGQTFSTVAFAWIRLSISDFPTRHPYGLAIAQSEVEELLAGWIKELGVEIRRGCRVVGLSQDTEGVRVTLANGESLAAEYLVGCDGGRSSVRKFAGIGFEGWDPSISNLLAEVEMAEEPEIGLRHDALGVHSLTKEGSGRVRVLVTEPTLERRGEPTLDDLRAALVSAYGSDFGVHSPITISRFTDVTRQASQYRKERVLLAGDAAHIHYPAGGLGLNLGLQDAVNLGWKLAQVIKQISPEALLDTYQAEQHPVAARVLRDTMAQVALLGRLDDRKAALRTVFSELLAMPEPRTQIGAMMSGLDIQYGTASGHPLLGRRMPDVDIRTTSGESRVYSLLHSARPLLLNFGEPGRFGSACSATGVTLVEGATVSTWGIPLLGTVARPTAILVRPDGHVAWVDQASDQTLKGALEQWFGFDAAAEQAPTALEGAN